MSHGKDVLDGLRNETAALREKIPGVYEGFAHTHKAALGDGVLSIKHKELIAFGIAVTKQCDGCIASHARGAARAGASLEEAAEAIGVAILMNGGLRRSTGRERMPRSRSSTPSSPGCAAPKAEPPRPCVGHGPIRYAAAARPISVWS